VLGRHQRYADGSEYVGQWEYGVRSGYGACTCAANREKYLGMWLANERHGEVCYPSQMWKLIGQEMSQLCPPADHRPLPAEALSTMPQGVVVTGESYAQGALLHDKLDGNALVVLPSGQVWRDPPLVLVFIGYLMSHPGLSKWFFFSLFLLIVTPTPVPSQRYSGQWYRGSIRGQGAIVMPGGDCLHGIFQVSNPPPPGETCCQTAIPVFPTPRCNSPYVDPHLPISPDQPSPRVSVRRSPLVRRIPPWPHPPP
jgi:hypothetical protein